MDTVDTAENAAAGGSAEALPGVLPNPANGPLEYLRGLLAGAVRQGISDIHIKSGSPPYYRSLGLLGAVPGAEALSTETVALIAEALMQPHERQVFAERHQVDLARGFAKLGRVRASVFRQRGSVSLALRVIPTQIPGAAQLGLPPAIAGFANLKRGLVLVTGATGSGKSTTLACLIQMINDAAARHIITIEDPVEYLFRDQRCMISQREVGIDTPGFAEALRAALRQDPDVIFIGELRDAETINTAVKASETGHLVLSTLHAPSCPEAITRLLAHFPPQEQITVRMAIAANLRAVVSQRLLPQADGKGRVAAFEVMTVTKTVREMIEDPLRQSELREAIRGGAQHGMVDFDDSLYALSQRGLITTEEALENASNLTDLRLRFQGF